MYDGDTIHAVAQALFEAAVEYKSEHVTDFSIQVDRETETVSSEVIVATSELPGLIPQKVNADVERQVIAYLADVGLAVSVGNYPTRGRAFRVALPPELVGVSRDKFRNRRLTSHKRT